MAKWTGFFLVLIILSNTHSCSVGYGLLIHLELLHWFSLLSLCPGLFLLTLSSPSILLQNELEASLLFQTYIPTALLTWVWSPETRCTMFQWQTRSSSQLCSFLCLIPGIHLSGIHARKAKNDLMNVRHLLIHLVHSMMYQFLFNQRIAMASRSLNSILKAVHNMFSSLPFPSQNYFLPEDKSSESTGLSPLLTFPAPWEFHADLRSQALACFAFLSWLASLPSIKAYASFNAVPITCSR